MTPLPTAADVETAATRLAPHVRRTPILRTDVDGGPLVLHPDSICVHGDTRGAVEIARQVREALTAAGIDLAPFAP